MTEEKRNDEIDLIELFLNIYAFFKKHFWFLFIVAIIGGVIGYSAKSVSKEHYESSMLIKSYTVSNDIIIKYVENMQSLISDGNYKYLSEKMNLDRANLVSLKKISAETVYDERNKNKSLDYIQISVNVMNNQLLQHLNIGIANFLAKEPFVQNEIEIYRTNNEELILEIDKQISKLEALQQRSIKDSEKKGDVNIYNEEKSFQDELLDLIKEKQEREESLKFAAPYRVIQDFTIYRRPIKNTRTYTLSSAFLFVFLALAYLIIKNINKTLKEREIAR